MKNIFVSSTFRDMQAERDMVQKEVLPQLRNKAKAYGENINMIDLRWGVDTSELESEEGARKVMSVCLDEVDRSRPHMLIFLGERYGSIIDPAITKQIIARKDPNFTLEDYAISITAMEVEFGALAEQYKSLENCVVCVRHFSPELISDETWRAIYSAEDEERAKKQQAFIEKVRAKVQGHLIEYTCDCDEEKQQLVNFKTLDGELLSDKLTKSYEIMFQAGWESYQKLSWQEKEQLAVDALMESKLRCFSGREAFLDACYDRITQEEETLILQGEVGSGKTSIMCKLMERLEQNGEKVFRFIAGNSSMSETAMQLVQQMVWYLEKELGVAHYEESVCQMPQELEQIAEDEKGLNYSDWLERLETLAMQLGSGEKIYFIIDALDQMYQDENAKRMDFVLPDTNFKYVLSVTADYKLPAVSLGRRFMVEEVPALKVQDAKEVMEGILAASSRNMYKDVQDVILAKESVHNPLYISMLIQRLNMMGFDELYHAATERDIIARSLRTIEEIPDNLEDAVTYLIEEAIHKLDVNAQALTDVINLIGVSRGGLRESDIRAITQNLGNPVNQLDIARLIHYLDTFFVIHKDGRIDITHKVIRKSIRENADCEKYIRTIAERVRELEPGDDFWKSEGMYYARLMQDAVAANAVLKYVLKTSDKTVQDAIKAEGLADKGSFYCEKMSEMQSAMDFYCLYWNRLFDVTEEEILLEERVCKCYIELLEKDFAPYANMKNIRRLSLAYANLGMLYYFNGRLEEAFAYEKKSQEVKCEIYQHKKTMLDKKAHVFSYVRLGIIRKAQGKNREALAYFEEALEHAKTEETQENVQNEKIDLTPIYEQMAVTLRNIGELEQSLSYFEKMVSNVDKEKMDVRGLQNLAFRYREMGRTLQELERREEALVCAKKVLELTERLYKQSRTLQNMTLLESAYNELGNVLWKQRNMEEALVYARKALEISEAVYQQSKSNKSLKDLAFVCNNVGNIFLAQKKYAEALVYCKKTLEAYELICQYEDNPRNARQLATCYSNMGMVLAAQEELETAHSYYEKALQMRESLYMQDKNLNNRKAFDFSCFQMGVIEQKLGNLKEAYHYFRRCMEEQEKLCEQSNSPANLWRMASAYYKVGNVLQESGEVGESYYQKALKISIQIEEEVCKMKSRPELAGFYKRYCEMVLALLERVKTKKDIEKECQPYFEAVWRWLGKYEKLASEEEKEQPTLREKLTEAYNAYLSGAE